MLFIYPFSYTLMLLKHWVDEKEKEVGGFFLVTNLSLVQYQRGFV